MFKKMNVFKVMLGLILVIILVDFVVEYNEGRNLNKFFDEYMSNDKYTEYYISITKENVEDNLSYTHYKINNKELISELLNYIKDLEPNKINDDYYESNDEKLDINYTINITSRYYITEKKDTHTLRKQKTDELNIRSSDSNRILVRCYLDTDYKGRYNYDYRINHDIDESFIDSLIEKYSMIDTSEN